MKTVPKLVGPAFTETGIRDGDASEGPRRDSDGYQVERAQEGDCPRDLRVARRVSNGASVETRRFAQSQ